MELFLLAFALSMDSVAVAMAYGARNLDMKMPQITKIAFFYAFFQILMPLIGYFLGVAFAKFVASIDHYIAFVILGVLGIMMIKEAFEPNEANTCITNKELTLSAIATSIDALAVGVTFAFVNTNIALVLGVIFGVCFLLCIGACFVGKKLGTLLRDKALILGGVILILIGVKIILEHLGFIKF